MSLRYVQAVRPGQGRPGKQLVPVPFAGAAHMKWIIKSVEDGVRPVSCFDQESAVVFDMEPVPPSLVCAWKSKIRKDPASSPATK